LTGAPLPHQMARMEGDFHLTPRSLVGRRFGPDTFAGIRVALMGFCPPPPAFARYRRERVRDQPFIHMAPDSVRIVESGGLRLLSPAHVYGGPVASATVEELAWYGVGHVLAYGLAGALGVGDATGAPLEMGDVYVVRDALARDGTTPHYTDAPLAAADPGLVRRVLDGWSGPGAVRPVRAATQDALYRESDALLDGFRAAGCHLVNLDSAHLYAASRANAEGRRLRAVQCGVVSDVIGRDGSSRSDLAAMLAPGGGADPLERTGGIVRFYVETLAPELAG
jgi:uridine phosphorylase